MKRGFYFAVNNGAPSPMYYLASEADSEITQLTTQVKHLGILLEAEKEDVKRLKRQIEVAEQDQRPIIDMLENKILELQKLLMARQSDLIEANTKLLQAPDTGASEVKTLSDALKLDDYGNGYQHFPVWKALRMVKKAYEKASNASRTLYSVIDGANNAIQQLKEDGYL